MPPLTLTHYIHNLSRWLYINVQFLFGYMECFIQERLYFYVLEERVTSFLEISYQNIYKIFSSSGILILKNQPSAIIIKNKLTALDMFLVTKNHRATHYSLAIINCKIRKLIPQIYHQLIFWLLRFFSCLLLLLKNWKEVIFS